MSKTDEVEKLRAENTALRASAHTAWRHVAHLADAHGEHTIAEAARRRLDALDEPDPLLSITREMIAKLDGHQLDAYMDMLEAHGEGAVAAAEVLTFVRQAIARSKAVA